VPSTSGLNLNDAVHLVFSVPPGNVRETVVKAYMHAWQVGCWVLAGIAAAQFVLALLLRPVEFSDGTKPSDGVKTD
jgi:hypothetical protein